MILNLAGLQSLFEKELAEYSAALPDNNLHAPVRYILALDGKRIRPVLVLMAGKAYGADIAALLPAALAVEIFHNFSLVHDDIMDEAPMRRGQKTVHAKWNSNAAILSGDAMLIEAYKQLALAGKGHLEELMELFNTTSMEVCEGQQLDMDFEKRKDVRADEYIEMISLKTAVLLGCSLKMGAILGGAGKEDADRIYNFGKLAGIAFQIQDDYLDAFGNPDNFGKQVGGDIIANKKTFLIIRALEIASALQREELSGIYFDETIGDAELKVERVLKTFTDLGIDRITRSESDRYFDLAREELSKVSIAVEHKEVFLEFLGVLEKREK